MDGALGEGEGAARRSGSASSLAAAAATAAPVTWSWWSSGTAARRSSRLGRPAIVVARRPSRWLTRTVASDAGAMRHWTRHGATFSAGIDRSIMA